jgi:hypothetical protein
VSYTHIVLLTDISGRREAVGFEGPRPAETFRSQQAGATTFVLPVKSPERYWADQERAKRARDR